MQTRYKHIHFLKVRNDWICLSNSDNTPLGAVEVWEDWRQYCFFPYPDTLHSASCLTDIAHFLQQLNKGATVDR